jgi:hypothetical protein
MASVIIVPKSAFRFTKGELKYHSVLGDSGKEMSRGFCASCGAPIATKIAAMPDVMAIKVASLDEPGRFKPTMNLYMSSAQPWAPVAPGLQNFDKMPSWHGWRIYRSTEVPPTRFSSRAAVHIATIWPTGSRRVRGPLNVARPIQGWPVIVQAGASEAGRQLAAETAEVIFAAGNNLASARAFYADVKGRMEKLGRDRDHLKVLPGAFVVVGDTVVEAREKGARLDSLVHYDSAIASLSIALGHDASRFDPDGPLPEILKAMRARVDANGSSNWPGARAWPCGNSRSV